MKSSWLARFLVLQMAALAIACVTPMTQAKTADSNRVHQPSPLDALASDPLLDTPSVTGSLAHTRHRHHDSTAGAANCVADTPPASNTGHRGNGRHSRSGPPTTTLCPPSDPPPSSGTNCVDTAAPTAITTPVVVAPPVSNTARHHGGNSGGRNSRHTAPPPPTTTDVATETATTPCPDPNSGGTGASDGSGGFTDVVAGDPLGPHHHHRHRVNQAPEPGTLALLALGLGSFWLGRRRSNRR
jgi:hypothetical protein